MRKIAGLVVGLFMIGCGGAAVQTNPNAKFPLPVADDSPAFLFPINMSHLGAPGDATAMGVKITVRPALGIIYHDLSRLDVVDGNCGQPGAVRRPRPAGIGRAIHTLMLDTSVEYSVGIAGRHRDVVPGKRIDHSKCSAGIDGEREMTEGNAPRYSIKE